LKDMRLLQRVAGESPPPLAGAIERVLAMTAENGHADADFIAMMKNLEPEAAGPVVET
jgi:3-hydroxyisobutyrate dehydrogenase-like beta-hydroxyacid dehydrogenase